jgi:four helix bundle protein
MNERVEALRQRTFRFAVDILALCRKYSDTPESRVVRHQLAKCGTSIAANYRATCRSRSRAEFVARLAVVLEEADESEYWLLVTAESGLLARSVVEPLSQEAGELVAIFTASLVTARRDQGERM